MRFLYYDVETANTVDYGSVCAVGWVLTDNDREISRGYTLIDPLQPFDAKCVSIHGITEEEVKGAPTFADYWNATLRSLMSRYVVVAHNAAFDIAATRCALKNAGVDPDEIVFVDSLEMLRLTVDAEHFSLTSIAEALGITYQAHNAQEDAATLAEILRIVAARAECDDVSELVLRSGVELRRGSEVKAGAKRGGTRIAVSPAKKQRCHEDVEAKDQQLAGLRFCLTGDSLDGTPRDELERRIQEHGGKTTGSVSGKTDFLVEGVYPEYGPDFVSSKKKAALAEIDKGGKIRIIDYAELYKMLGEDAPC